MALLALPDREDYLNAAATLTYKRYPGSGTNLTLGDVQEMEWHRILWWYGWLQERWDEESQAIKKANQRK